MMHLHLTYLGIGLCLISSCGYIHRAVHSRLEIDSLIRTVVFHMADIDVGTGTMHVTIDMSYFMGYSQGGIKTGKELLSETKSVRVFLFRNSLDVHLWEDFGEELHAMLIIQGEELIVLLFGDVMADGLSVDYGGHPVLDFILCRLIFAFDFAFF